ncbi:hypothetical protein D3C76_1501000 [compost metagenome]
MNGLEDLPDPVQYGQGNPVFAEHGAGNEGVGKADMLRPVSVAADEAGLEDQNIDSGAFVHTVIKMDITAAANGDLAFLQGLDFTVDAKAQSALADQHKLDVGMPMGMEGEGIALVLV